MPSPVDQILEDLAANAEMASWSEREIRRALQRAYDAGRKAHGRESWASIGTVTDEVFQRDQRQSFLDAAAIQALPHCLEDRGPQLANRVTSAEWAYNIAQALWAERKRRRK